MMGLPGPSIRNGPGEEKPNILVAGDRLRRAKKAGRAIPLLAGIRVTTAREVEASAMRRLDAKAKPGRKLHSGWSKAIRRAAWQKAWLPFFAIFQGLSGSTANAIGGCRFPQCMELAGVT